MPGWWVLVLLSLYGLASLVVMAVDLLFRLAHPAPGTFTVGVLVQNQADQVEGFARSLLWRISQQGLSPQVFLIDLGSTDETPVILHRLAAEAPALRVVVLPHEQRENPCEAAHHLGRGPVTILIDLRRQRDVRRALDVLTSVWK